MKKVLVALLTILTLAQCRKDVDPPKEIAALAGTWYLAETWTEVGGKSAWQTNISQYPYNHIFRSDRVVVNEYGKAICCGPTSIIYNGKLIDVNPEGKVEHANCASIRCSDCVQWKITQRGDELILQLCEASPMKFRKMP